MERKGTALAIMSLASDVKGLAVVAAPALVLLYLPVIFTGFALFSGFGVSLFGGIILFSSAVFLGICSLLFMMAALLPVAFLARILYPQEFKRIAVKALQLISHNLSCLRRVLRTEENPPNGALYQRIHSLKLYASRAISFMTENLDRLGKYIHKIDN